MSNFPYSCVLARPHFYISGDRQKLVLKPAAGGEIANVAHHQLQELYPCYFNVIFCICLRMIVGNFPYVGLLTRTKFDILVIARSWVLKPAVGGEIAANVAHHQLQELY